MGIEFKDQTVQLSEGEMIVVPRGEEHKPFAKDECKVLLVEPKGVVNTGETIVDLTAEAVRDKIINKQIIKPHFQKDNIPSKF